MKYSWVEAVTECMEQNALGRVPVPACSAGLLVVGLDGARHRVMKDEAHVRLVDAHPEGIGWRRSPEPAPS